MAADSISQGMILKVKKGSGGILAAIGGITNFSGPGASRTVIQIGANDSTNSTNVQKAGRTTRGAWNFTVNLDPASSTQAREAYSQMQLASSGVNNSASATDYYTWEITFDNGTTATFNGFVSDFNIDGADDDKVTATFSVTMQSDVTFA